MENGIVSRPTDASALLLEAQSRAPIYKRVLERIDALSPRKRSAVFEHLDPAIVRDVREASRLSWFHYSVNAHFDRAILLGLGEHEALRFWQSYGLYVATEGVFRKTVEGVMRLFGASPALLFKRYPDGYHFATKNQGYVTAHRSGEDELTIRMEGLPPGVVTEGFITAQRGALQAVLKLTGCFGEVDVDDSNAPIGLLEFRCRWVL